MYHTWILSGNRLFTHSEAWFWQTKNLKKVMYHATDWDPGSPSLNGFMEPKNNLKEIATPQNLAAHRQGHRCHRIIYIPSYGKWLGNPTQPCLCAAKTKACFKKRFLQKKKNIKSMPEPASRPASPFQLRWVPRNLNWPMDWTHFGCYISDPFIILQQKSLDL